MGERLARVEEKIAAMQHALELQAREYERRLDELNHAHEQNEQRQARYISEDKFAGHVKEWQIFKDHVTATLNTLAGRSGGSGSTWEWVLRLATVGIALGAVLLAWGK